jgi:predicted dinucleotide-binding enzyme
MSTAIIGTGGLGSVIARRLASGGETLRLSSADTESARTLAAAIGRRAAAAPSLSTSGETATIEESMTLRARTENAGHGDEYEWSWSGG